MPEFAPYYINSDNKAFMRIDSANTDYYWYYWDNYRRSGHVTVAPMFFFNISQYNIGVSLVSGAIATYPDGNISETTSIAYNAVSGRVYYYYEHSTGWSGFSPVPSEDFPSTPSIDIFTFNSISDGIEAIDNYVSPSITYPITYRLTNCTAPSAPTEAAVGDTVTVSPQFTSGYGIVNPSSDVYVMNNGVIVPSTWSNGVLTFTMPDPS